MTYDWNDTWDWPAAPWRKRSLQSIDQRQGITPEDLAHQRLLDDACAMEEQRMERIMDDPERYLSRRNRY